jgi:hypothetical protein
VKKLRRIRLTGNAAHITHTEERCLKFWFRDLKRRENFARPEDNTTTGLKEMGRDVVNCVRLGTSDRDL